MKRESNTVSQQQSIGGVTRRALLAAGILGFGFSGLIDVLVLHLVFQWHHLLSGIYPMYTLEGLQTNIVADGVFSIAMLVIMCIGGGLLWQSERRHTHQLAVRPLAGAGIIGLGGFDLYDAIVDHAILGIHQPFSGAGRPLGIGGQYNIHWTVVSLLFIGAGYYIYRTASRPQKEKPGEA
ncbi:DUF2243 domain-containing protein [Halococcus sediminicola]|uniref:DUF2243 domain-containing protein n=1 Tax=Halococcus sediminicola TaxID=1264579 RepID=UPI000679B37E|nr:DUF2243 domain-containing protein [Halococcus sediminicola]